MKQETKELIDWIKKQINLSGTIVTNLSQPNWQKDKEKAIKFLDSLSEIEKKLCFGGYIQDRNGTPCCNGDRILHNGNLTGTLRYTKEDGIDIFPHWWFDLDDKDTVIPLFEWFEKVER